MAKLPTVEQMKFRRYPPLKSGPPILWPTKRYFRRNEGTTDYATIPEVTLAGDFVIEFELSTIANSNSAILGSASSIDITMLSSGFVRLADGVTAITSNITVNDGAFHKVAVSREEGTVSFFVDGIPAGGGVSSASLLFEQLYRDVTTNYLAGILANLKIYDNGTLIRDYPLDDNSSTIRDKANGQNGTIINGNADDWGLFDRQADGDWLGQELIVNGGFDSASGWTMQENWSISNGNAISNGASDGIIYRAIARPFEYQVSGILSNSSSGKVYFYNGNNYSSSVSSPGPFSITVINANEAYEFFTMKAFPGNEPVLESVSLKEVLKNA